MSQKSKTLLQLLQQQQTQHSFHDENNASIDSYNKKNLSEHTEKKQDLKLQKSIFELYSTIRANILKTEDQLLICQIKKLVPIDKHVEDHCADSNTLLCYIGCILTQLLQDKFNLEQELEEIKKKEQSDYEEQLIRLEAEIRQHIRIEQQLKLFAENTQSKLEDTLKLKEEIEEENQILKADYQMLYDKYNTLNLKVKSHEQENQILKTEFNNYRVHVNQQKVLTKNQNLENIDHTQKPISINLQLERLQRDFKPHNQSLEFHERIMTEPYEQDYQRGKAESQKKVNMSKLPNNGLAQRVNTDIQEHDMKKKRSNLSSHEPHQVAKHSRVKTYTNATTLVVEKQELRRQPSAKTCNPEPYKSSIANKPKKTVSQHSDANRSNNSVHSFRKGNGYEGLSIPRPFSSVEQMEEPLQPSVGFDYLSMDVGNLANSKEHHDSQLMKKLLQQYQQKNVLNDQLTKKLLQECKKRQNYNSKTIY